jgi:uncharacterized protein (TIGR03382 family)
MKKRATHDASRQQTGVRTLAAALLTPWLALQGCAKQEAPAQETGKTSAAKQGVQNRATKAETLRTADGAEYLPGKLIVRFKDGAALQSAASLHSKLGAEVVKTFSMMPDLQVVAIKGDIKDAQAAYLADPRVAYAEPNYVYRINGAHTAATPNDARFGELWGMHNTGQSSGLADTDINAPEAWELTTGSDTAGVITVIDTGIDYTHPDLVDNVWTNPGEIAGNGVDDDANGYIDDMHGINAIDGDGDPMDDNDHGSHCMGSIAGRGNNGVGVAGVNWTAKVMGCKFLDAEGSGYLEDAITCFNYVHMMKTRENHPVNIVATSNSWGGGGFSQAMLDGIIQHRNDGTLFIAAAGNDSANNDTTASYPNGYFVSNVIAVAAHDRSNNMASFSSYGRRTVHVSAPGVAVLSTTPGNTYQSFNGTSMATPHVTGLVALLKAQDPSRDWKQLKNLVLAGGVASTHANGKTLTGKRIRAADADGKGSLTCANQVFSTRVRPMANTASVNVGQELPVIAYNINCANPAGAPTITVSPSGGTITLVDDGTNGDETAGDGMYTGSFKPTTVGTFTLTFPDGETLTVNSVVSYIEEPALYSYRTITGTSLAVTDESMANITSPFPIPFAGGAGQTALRVGMNGGIRFGTTGSLGFSNGALPSTTGTTLVAPFWDDLFPGPTAADNVFWAVQGTAPNRELVIEWRNVHHYSTRTATPANTLTFQVVFFEGQSEILYNYKDVVVGNTTLDKGAGATVGVQVGAATATQHSYNTPSVQDGTAIFWRMPDLSAKPEVADLVLTPLNLNEGDTLSIDTSFTDPDGDTNGPFKVEYDLDYTGMFNADVTQTVAVQGPISTTSPVLASGEVKVAVRVTDKTGTRSVLKTATVMAQDVVPVVAEASVVGDAKERNAVNFTATFVDPGADSPWKAEWDFDYDGSTFDVNAQATAATAGVTTASHTYANDGTYTVAVRVTDKNGVPSELKTFSVSVADLVPMLQPLVGNAATIEGEMLALASSFTDPGDASKPWTLQWDFSYDGTTFNVDSEETMEAAGALNYKRFMEDSGAFTIALRVVDADGSISAVQTVDVTAADVSPVLGGFVAQPLSATQSEPLSVDFRLNARGGSLTAPAVDPIQVYLWDFDNDGEFDYLSTTPRALYRYQDNPANGGENYTVRVRVEDEDSYTEATVPVKVLNTAPVLATIANQHVVENSLLSLRVQATDKGADTLSFSLANAPAGMSITPDGLIFWKPTSQQAKKPGKDFTVTVIVTDDDGATDSQEVVFTAANAAPTMAPLSNQSVTEGQLLSVRAQATDVGGGDLTFSLVNAPEGMSITQDGLILWTPNAAQATKQGAAFAVTVTVTDDDGDSASQTATFTALNVPPRLAALENQSIPEGRLLSVRAQGSDVGNGPLTYSLTGAPEGMSITQDGLILWTPTYTQATKQGAAFTVTVTVKDDDGDAASQTATFTAMNVAPRLAALGNQGVMEGKLVSVRALGTDDGNGPLTYSLTGAPAGMSITQDGLILWTPLYSQTNAAGVAHPITVTVTDDDGESASQALTLTARWQDTDGDGMPDTWERSNGTNPMVADADVDSNRDGVSNMAEFHSGNGGPMLPDTAAAESPLSGKKVDTAELKLTTRNVVNAGSLAARKYQFQLFSDAALTTPVREATVDEDPSGMTAAVFTNSAESNLVDLVDDAAYSWRVRSTDGQFHGAWSQVQSITYNPVNDAPSIARAVQPMPQSQVATFKPLLTVDNATDVDDSELTYLFEVAENAALTQGRQESNPINGGARGSTSWAVAADLKDRTTYYWRVTAVDPHGARTEGEVASFTVFLGRAPNRQPFAPELETAAVVETAQPMLVAHAATDLDGDTLTYVFELDTLASFSTADYQSSDAMVESNGNIRWTPASLKENTRYFWRVRALDNASASDWAIGTFVVNARNDAPSAPVALSPSEALIITQKPTLTVQNAADPEGDTVTYEFEVLNADGSLAESIKAVAAGANGTTSATLTKDLAKGKEYKWTAYATDAKGEKSPVSATARFQVYEAPVVQTPPQADAGCSAAPGASAAGLLPMLALALGLLGRRRRNS